MRWLPSRSGAARQRRRRPNTTIRRHHEVFAARNALGTHATLDRRRTKMAAVSANRLELLQIADAVAREKAIDRGIVITAMEDAIAKAARSRYGAETDVHA